MGDAFDVYDRVRSGALQRFPHGFWTPPAGFTNLVEIIRRLCAEAAIHPSQVSAMRLKEWGLSSPLVNLFRNNVAKVQELASAGVPFPIDASSTDAPSGPAQRMRLSNAVMSEVWIRDGGKCSACGSQENLEFDHIVPFSKGGSSTAENLRILCRPCNRSRGNRI